MRTTILVLFLSSCALAQRAGTQILDGQQALTDRKAEEAARRVAKTTAIDTAMAVVKNMNEPVLEAMKSHALQMELLFNMSAKQTEQFEILKNSFADVTKSMNSYILANDKKHRRHKREIAKLKDRVAESESK